MKTILFTGDFLFHSFEHLNETLWEHELFIPITSNVIGENIQITRIPKTEKDEVFSREYFYSLGGLQNPKYKYQEYDINKFSNEQLEYLSKFFNSNIIVIGFELYKNFANLLSRFGCQIIDFAFHSYKLFDDLTFGIATNNKNIYDQLKRYQIPQDKFYFYANYWKVFMKYNHMIQDSDIKDNAALFIGQTLVDKSVEKDGIYLNVTHFEDKLKELSKEYSIIYYLPHPMLGRKRKVIYDWVKERPFIELLTNRSTYGLLASTKIKKVIGISTSVLYEAQYFNKDVEYLYKPLFNIDTAFEDYSFVSVLDDYFNPKFWADILSPVCNVKTEVEDVNYIKPSRNRIRDIQGLYWGYAQLDPIKRIPNFQESVANLYRQYISPHIPICFLKK